MPIPFEDNKKRTKKTPQIPPHNGFGSEIDSLGNCYNLIPKPPKINMAKKFIYNRVILRFVCRKISSFPEDLLKRFLLSFYCGDDTLMLYVQTDRNSGILNGKYLERSRYKNDESGEYISMADLHMGAVLKINKQLFQIEDADEYSLNFMYQKPELFPLSNRERLYEILLERTKEAEAEGH